MSKAERIPRTGIELMVGQPGAGKSFVAMRKVIDVVINHRRPVYTSLPIVWPVMRRWLRNRGGPELANLIHPLSEEHFRRFIERYEERRQWREALKLAEPKLSRREVESRWLEHAGPDLVRGDSANWVPSGAVLVLDEVHHWFPNPALKIAKNKPEPPALLSYLTMHRHLLHWVWFTTQAHRQVSTTIKSLASVIWDIRSKDEERVVFGVRFRDIGIRALAYAAYSPLQWDDGNPKEPPSEQFVILPGMPWNRWVFRLYTSFTHAGDSRSLKRGLEQARIEAGLSADGAVVTETEQGGDMPKRSGGVFSFVTRWAVRAALLGVVLIVGVALGSIKNARELEAAAAAAAVPVVDQEPPPPDRSVELRSILGEVAVFTNGDKVREGDTRFGLSIVTVDARGGGVVGYDAADGHIWLWRVGSTGRDLGPFERLRPLVDAWRSSEGAGASRRVGRYGAVVEVARDRGVSGDGPG